MNDYAVPCGLYLGWKVFELSDEALASALEDVQDAVVRTAILSEMGYRTRNGGRPSFGAAARRLKMPPRSSKSSRRLEEVLA